MLGASFAPSKYAHTCAGQKRLRSEHAFLRELQVIAQANRKLRRYAGSCPLEICVLARAGMCLVRLCMILKDSAEGRERKQASGHLLLQLQLSFVLLKVFFLGRAKFRACLWL